MDNLDMLMDAVYQMSILTDASKGEISDAYSECKDIVTISHDYFKEYPFKKSDKGLEIYQFTKDIAGDLFIISEMLDVVADALNDFKYMLKELEENKNN